MPENLTQDGWISLQAACDYLGVKRHTIMRWIGQRNTPASKIGKLWGFKTAELDELGRNGDAAEEQGAPQ